MFDVNNYGAEIPFATYDTTIIIYRNEGHHTDNDKFDYVSIDKAIEYVNNPNNPAKGIALWGLTPRSKDEIEEEARTEQLRNYIKSRIKSPNALYI